MHELSVCYSLLDQVRAIASEQGSERVTRIELDIGPLCGVEAELLRNAWPIASVDSIAEHAELRIEETAVVVRCTSCDAETTASVNKLTCGECGDFRTSLVSGDEMTLMRVELAAS